MDPCYPFATELLPSDDSPDGGWCILIASLHHRVYPRGLARLGTLGPGRRRARARDALDLAQGLGWSLHPYLCERFGTRLDGRAFAPLAALSPCTHEALFGPRAGFPESRIDGPADALDAVARRLGLGDGGGRHAGPLLLARACGGPDGHGGWLDGRLELGAPARGQAGASPGWRRGTVFRIAWADLWFFPDAHGLTHRGNAMLALKAVPLAPPAGDRAGDDEGPCRVGDLAELARALRDFDLGPRGGALVRPAGSQEAPRNLWQAVLEDWLGVTLGPDRRVAGAHERSAPRSARQGGTRAPFAGDQAAMRATGLDHNSDHGRV